MKSKMLKASLNSYALESFEVFTHKYGGNAHAVPEETCNAEYSATTKFAKHKIVEKLTRNFEVVPTT